jgi:hypothetical protein
MLSALATVRIPDSRLQVDDEVLALTTEARSGELTAKSVRPKCPLSMFRRITRLQLARERRTPVPMTGERNIRRSDNLFLDRILYLETADHSGKISVGADGYFDFRFVKYFL